MLIAGAGSARATCESSFVDWNSVGTSSWLDPIVDSVESSSCWMLKPGSNGPRTEGCGSNGPKTFALAYEIKVERHSNNIVI
jgi:hypothetical protein